MASYIVDRFGAATGSTSATASTTVTTSHRFVVMGGGASITTGSTAGTVTCTLTTGSATHTWKVGVSTTSSEIMFVVGDGGAAEGTDATPEFVVISIGKNHVAKSGETLSLAISGPTGSTGASAHISGIDYTE